MQTENHEQVKEINLEMTPFVVGPGIKFSGVVEHSGDPHQRAVVMGEFDGDIQWNGVLHVPKGGEVRIKNSLKCREMIVGGKITGNGPDAIVETGLLRLRSTSVVDVSTISVPVGGIEQLRGSRINAKLLMTDDHPYQGTVPAPEIAQSPTVVPETLPVTRAPIAPRTFPSMGGRLQSNDASTVVAPQPVTPGVDAFSSARSSIFAAAKESGDVKEGAVAQA